MSESVKQTREEERRDQNFGDWPGIFSAWAIAVFVVMLFIGVQAIAALRGVSPHQASFAGAAQVPRHDPACAGPVVANASPIGSAACQTHRLIGAMLHAPMPTHSGKLRAFSGGTVDTGLHQWFEPFGSFQF